MEVNSGGSFGAKPFRREIGLGKATSIDSLVVRWPTSGITQVFTDVKPCQFLTIREDGDKLERVDLKREVLHGKTKNGSMGMEMLDCGPPK
jgi:hypothetical protein